MKDKILDIFRENGVFIESSDYELELELDSMQFVSIIVSLEDAFCVEIPSEYLSSEKLKSLKDFENVIMNCGAL